MSGLIGAGIIKRNDVKRLTDLLFATQWRFNMVTYWQRDADKYSENQSFYWLSGAAATADKYRKESAEYWQRFVAAVAQYPRPVELRDGRIYEI